MSILNPSGRVPIVGDVTEFDCRMREGAWVWADANADAIAAHWQEAVSAKPNMFDGTVVVATEVGIEKSRLVSSHIQVRYSALNYWQKQGFPRADAFNLFGSGVVVSRDGGVLLGRMGTHTANAGFTYFPCGTPDMDDVVDSRLDIEGSIVRELQEETGLGPDQLRPSEQRWISWDGPLFCCARRFDSELTAVELESHVAAHLASESRPELEEVLILRSLEGFDASRMPAYVLALLSQLLPDQAD